MVKKKGPLPLQANTSFEKLNSFSPTKYVNASSRFDTKARSLLYVATPPNGVRARSLYRVVRIIHIASG